MSQPNHTGEADPGCMVVTCKAAITNSPIHTCPAHVCGRTLETLLLVAWTIWGRR